MAEILKFNLNNNAVACVLADGNPWLKAREVATILGYANTKQAITKNVDEDDKQTYAKILETLQVGGLSERPPDSNDKNAIYINEPALYSLILNSRKQEAKAFKKWVCSEVLPDIRKHGVYVTKAASIERIQNPTGETKLH